MPSSVRQYWRDLQGRTSLNFNWDAINHDSVVAVTASEFNPDPNDPSHSPRFVGDATITVENISPHGPPFDGNHGVTFVVNVDWGAPLNVVTDITVLDAPPVDIEYQKSILSFVMPTQLQSQWCWAATSLGVAQYYDPATTWTQCTIANSQLSRSDCCGVGAAGACNVGQVLDNPLQIVGHLDRMVLSVTAFADVATEVNSGRPHCIRITWSGGGAHFIAAIGYIGSDPATGQFLLRRRPDLGTVGRRLPHLADQLPVDRQPGTQLLHEGLGPLMAPELKEPPPEAHRVASDAVGWLGRHGGLAARLPADVSVDDLELTKPHEELSLGLDDLTAGRGLGRPSRTAGTTWSRRAVHRSPWRSRSRAPAVRPASRSSTTDPSSRAPPTRWPRRRRCPAPSRLTSGCSPYRRSDSSRPGSTSPTVRRSWCR